MRVHCLGWKFHLSRKVRKVIWRISEIYFWQKNWELLGETEKVDTSTYINIYIYIENSAKFESGMEN